MLASSFRNYLLAVILNIITLILTCTALFTCRWSYFADSNTGLGVLNIFLKFPTCGQYGSGTTPVWMNITAAFMITALICQALLLIQAIFTLVFNCERKLCHLDDTFQSLSWFLVMVSVIFYAVYSQKAFKNNAVYSSWKLSWSFILACVAIGTSFGSLVVHGMYKFINKREYHAV